MTDPAFPPIVSAPKRTATDLSFEALYQAVIALELPPGAKVSEAEIAKALDVSRQPVRDAFYRLSKLGFLSMRPQRATLVTKISKRAVLNAIFVRTALEVEALRTAMQKSREELFQRLSDNLDLQQKAVSADDPSAFHTQDEHFHQIICECAGHGHVWALIKEHKAHMDRIRYLTLSHERRLTVLSEHEGIVDAIESGNAALAEDRFRAHLGAIRHVLDGVRQKYSDYFEEDA